MKKYLIPLIILLCVSLASAGNLQKKVIARKNAAVATCTTTNIIFWWRCEAADFTATNGTLDYSAASPVGTINGGTLFNADAKKYGTNGMDLPTPYSFIYFTTPSASWDDEGKIGAWVRLTTFTDDRTLIYLYGDANNYFRVRLDGTEELNFKWRDNTDNIIEYASSGAGLVADGTTWYWIEVAWKVSTNYRELFVNGVSVGSDSTAIATWAVATARIYFGDTVGGAQDTHMDNIIGGTVSTDDFYTVCKDELEWPE